MTDNFFEEEQDSPPGERKRRRWVVIAAVIAVTAAAGLSALVSWRNQEPPRLVQRPVAVKSDGYASSQSCRDCHSAQHKSWYATYHRTMTQIATPESVIGRFDGAPLRAGKLHASFHQHGSEFKVHLANGEEEIERSVVLTTGSHHMQVYWAPTGVARELAVIPFVYLIEDERWVPRPAVFLAPPGAGKLDSNGLLEGWGRWNDGCIQCHTTHGVPGIKANEYADTGMEYADTRVAEFGIACEACHGPGEAHARFHSEEGGDASDAAMVHPDDLSHRRASQICGQCHSVRDHLADGEYDRFVNSGSSYRPGEDLSKTVYVHSIPGKDSQFWSDGMVRVSGREYNGLKNSPCFKWGELSCMSCHVMHKAEEDPRPLREWANDQLGPGMEGNAACVQCHTQFGHEKELASHTHHAPGSSGSLCYNCHMPHTTYGLLKAIRSHQIDSPNVKDSLYFGRPNACNLCHLDKTLDWSASHLDRWYGIARPELNERQRGTSAVLLWLLTGDAGQRALAAWHMGWRPAQEASGTSWLAPFLAQLLDDPYDAVRYLTKRSLRTLPGFADFSYDFVGSAAHRAEARRRAVELWNKSPPGPLSAFEAILLDEQGNLRRQEMLELLKTRSNRRVLLEE